MLGGLRPDPHMGDVVLTLRQRLLQGAPHLRHRQDAAGGPGVGESGDRRDNIGEEFVAVHGRPRAPCAVGLGRRRNAPPVHFISGIDQVVRIVGDHENEGREFRLDCPDRPHELQRTGRTVVLDISAVDDAVDDAAVAAHHGAGRRDDREPNSRLGTDPHRLDSYTERFRAYQLAEFFKGTPYQFREFKKTDGYANLPLDGLWLRAPYLHNGAVPTLADLLEPPERRPQTFLRGGDVVDTARGGFQAPPCDPSAPPPPGRICFDTRLPGNGNGGHVYGADLPSAEKADLLAYLLTF